MKINYRQLSVLTFMSFIALKLLALPGVMYSVSESMSIFVSFIIMCIDAVFVFWIVSLMKKSDNKNIYEFMNWCLGPVLTKVLLAVLLFRYAFVIAHLTKGLQFFVVENLYKELHWLIYVLPLLALVGYIMYKGIRNIARVHELVYLFIFFGLIYIGLKSLESIDIVSSFLPLFKVPIEKLVESGYTHMNWFNSGAFIFMLFGFVDFKNEKKLQLAKYIGLAILLVSFMFFVFYGLFEVTSPIHNFCISDISEFSSGKSSINELSWLIVSLWIVAQAVQIALYAYCSAEAVKYLFNFKGNTVPIIIVLGCIFTWNFIGEKIIGIENIFFSHCASITAIVSQYVITPVLWVGYKVKLKQEKRRANYEKAKNHI